MRIYKSIKTVVRVTLSDNEKTIKFSIAESNCLEVCEMVSKELGENVLNIKHKGVGKMRDVSIRIDELDNSTEQMRKVSRTISLKDITINEAHERLINAVNEYERQSIIERAKQYMND